MRSSGGYLDILLRLQLQTLTSAAVVPTMVELLLKSGADPNAIISRRQTSWTNWTEFLTDLPVIEDHMQNPHSRARFEGIQHFLQYGADTNALMCRLQLLSYYEVLRRKLPPKFFELLGHYFGRQQEIVLSMDASSSGQSPNRFVRRLRAGFRKLRDRLG